MARNSTNGKVANSANLKNAASDLNEENYLSPETEEQNNRLDEIQFYANTSVTTHDYNDKDKFVTAYRKNNDAVDDWEIHKGIQTFKAFINEGFTVQCGVGATRYKKDVEFFDVFALDVDNWVKADINKETGEVRKEAHLRKDAITLEALLENKIIKNYFQFYQLSFTQRSKECPNVHLFGVFDKRNCDEETQEVFLKVISKVLRKALNSNAIDPALENNSTQVIYSGKQPIELINSDAFINIDKFLDDHPDELEEVEKELIGETKSELKEKLFAPNNSSPSVTQKENSSTQEVSTYSTNDQSRLEHIKSAIIDDKLGGDWSAIYCLHKHLWQPRSANHFDGSNPFSETDSSGTSFNITLEDDKLPPVWYSRCTVPFEIKDEINKGKKADGGDVILYWLFLHRLLPKQGKINPYAKIKDVKKQYIEAYKDLCKHFGVTPIDPRKKDDEKIDLKIDLKAIENSFHELAPNYIKLVKWGQSDKDVYLYWVFKRGIWEFTTSKSILYRECTKYFIDCPEHLKNNSKIIARIERCLLYDDILPCLAEKISFDYKRKKNVIPLLNGDYNTDTKQFTEAFEPTNNNFIRSDIAFKEITHNKGISLFEQWLDAMYPEAEQKMIKAWLIVNCLGRATETKRMLNIYGTPGTGKSVLLNLLDNVLGLLSTKELAKNFFMGGNKFSNQQLDGCFSLAIDEFSTNLEGWNHLKELSGNSDIKVIVEKKNQSPYKTLFFAGITTATQDKFYIPNSDDGGIRRRIVPLKHKLSMKNDSFEDIDSLFAKPEIYEEIFLWAIQQDGNQAVKDFIQYAKNEGRKALQETLQDNDRTLMFMATELVFTDIDTDVLTKYQIITAFKKWQFEEFGELIDNQNKDYVKNADKVYARMVEKAYIPDNGIVWNLKPGQDKNGKVKDCKVSLPTGGQERGYRGVRFKSESEKININNEDF